MSRSVHQSASSNRMEYDKSTIHGWNQMASLYQEKFMNFDLYNDTYDLFAEWIGKKDAVVLDVGCGPGNIAHYLASRYPGFRIEGIDAAENMIALAAKNVPSARFRVMDCRDVARLTSTYDGIICGFVMPYLSKEEVQKLIKDAAALLRQNGILYFSVMEDSYSKSRLETSSNGQYSTFVYYHQEDYLREALEKSGFAALQSIRKSYRKSEEEQSTHLIFIAKK